MTGEVSRFDPLASQQLFTEKVQAAAEHARETYNTISHGYTTVSGGTSFSPRDGSAEQLVRSLDSALQMDEVEGRHVLGPVLTDAVRQAERLDRLFRRSGGTGAVLQLDLFRGQYAARELVRDLDEAAARAARLSASRRPGGRSRAQEEALQAHRVAVALFDLRAPAARQQTIEVTLPGMLIAVAVLVLPAAHRSRYSEEFRAEVRELPADEQVGYARRQCLFALILRCGLARPSWRSRDSSSDDRNRRSRRPGGPR